MTPLDLAHYALLAISFALSLVLLAIVALIMEAIMFALGLMVQGWGSQPDR
jgi:hypothetical protein